MHNDFHFRWWHWLIIIVVIFIVVGIAVTLMNNYEIVKKNDQSYVHGIEETIEHPIDTTENVVNDITNK